MKTNIIPCPINEKDLCSDTLFDGLYDNDEYVEKDATLLGFIADMAVKTMYFPHSNVVHIVTEEETYGRITKRIEQWIKTVEASVNDNIPAEDHIRMKAEVRFASHAYLITFNYFG